MVEHGALSKSHVYRMLGSKDARVRRAAFTLLEASNPTLSRNSELLIEIIRFIWDANPSYDVYREFSNRHLLVPHKVHELIGARLKIERRERQSDPTDQRTEDTRQYKSGFFKRLFRRRRIPPGPIYSGWPFFAPDPKGRLLGVPNWSGTFGRSNTMMLLLVVLSLTVTLAGCSSRAARLGQVDNENCRRIVAERDQKDQFTYQKCRANLMRYRDQDAVADSGT